MSDSLWSHRWQSTRLLCPWDSPGKNTGVGCHFLLQFMKVKSESEVAQSCPTLSDPMDCSPPGSSVHGIFQARVLEWGAIAFSSSLHWPYSISFPPAIPESFCCPIVHHWSHFGGKVGELALDFPSGHHPDCSRPGSQSSVLKRDMCGCVYVCESLSAWVCVCVCVC